MDQVIDIVKRGGKRPNERFVREKLHASIYAACLSVKAPDGDATRTANNVCDAVIVWSQPKFEVTSNDLRRVASGHLEKFHPEAAYLYKHHRLVM